MPPILKGFRRHFKLLRWAIDGGPGRITSSSNQMMPQHVATLLSADIHERHFMKGGERISILVRPSFWIE